MANLSYLYKFFVMCKKSKRDYSLIVIVHMYSAQFVSNVLFCVCFFHSGRNNIFFIHASHLKKTNQKQCFLFGLIFIEFSCAHIHQPFAVTLSRDFFCHSTADSHSTCSRHKSIAIHLYTCSKSQSYIQLNTVKRNKQRKVSHLRKKKMCRDQNYSFRVKLQNTITVEENKLTAPRSDDCQFLHKIRIR